jgi:hypothetical protein
VRFSFHTLFLPLIRLEPYVLGVHSRSSALCQRVTWDSYALLLYALSRILKPLLDLMFF